MIAVPVMGCYHSCFVFPIHNSRQYQDHITDFWCTVRWRIIYRFVFRWKIWREVFYLFELLFFFCLLDCSCKIKASNYCLKAKGVGVLVNESFVNNIKDMLSCKSEEGIFREPCGCSSFCWALLGEKFTFLVNISSIFIFGLNFKDC